jgi:Ca2+:H+ antiporter
MNALLKEIPHDPLPWLLAFVPIVFAGERLAPEAHTLLFLLSVFAIVPLAALLSHATESVAAKTGDTVGGLLNATLGNLTALVIALSALRAGHYMLVKASSPGAQLSLGLSLLLIVAYGLGLVRRSAGVDGLFDPSRCSRAPGSG